VAIQAGRIRAGAIQAGRMLAVVIQADRIRAAAGRQDLTVVVDQAPRRRKVGESRVPSAARTKGVVRRWRVIAGSQAGKARPHNPRREVVAVAVVPVVAAVAVPAAAAVVAVAAVAAVAAAAEEDKEVRTCIPTHGKTKSGC
jgi:hypothetical protein